MPRFIVERDFGKVSEEGFQEISAQAKLIGTEHFPDVVWETSHVCATDDGSVTSFCVYEAPSAERLHEHTDRVPGLSVIRIYEIAASLAPAGATV